MFNSITRAILLTSAALVGLPAAAQQLEMRHHTHNECSRERFSEAVTVSGPGKWLFPAGVGAEAFKGGPLPVHTFLVVSHLARPGMIVEMDVIAMAPAGKKPCSPQRTANPDQYAEHLTVDCALRISDSGYAGAIYTPSISNVPGL